jgi:hypothetical protein
MEDTIHWPAGDAQHRREAGLMRSRFGQRKPGSHTSFLNRPAFIIAALKQGWQPREYPKLCV